MLDGTSAVPNTARFVLLDPRAPDFYLDWDRAARDCVAVLRSAAGRDPHDAALTELVGELSMRSDVFRAHWATHDVRFHSNGVKRFHHPIAGELQLNFERMSLDADPGLTIFTYTAAPGSSSAQALDLLASWAATPADERLTADDASTT